MKQGFLIYNPSAGTRAKPQSLVEEVVRQFAGQGIEIIPYPTQAGGTVAQDVCNLLTQKPEVIVAWGGDGTIHEVANGMFQCDIPLGILPGGTANVMVRELGLPLGLQDAVKVIAAGKTRRISIGQANSRYFVLMAGIGFDSEVIKNVNWDLKKRFGKLAFGISAWETAQKYNFPSFRLKIDDSEKEAVFAVICNARHYAAYFVLTPDADISDDYFYVCLFKNPGLVNMFWYALHAWQGNHLTLESVEMVRAKYVEITGPDQIAVQADGELIGHLPMKFDLHPQSLLVICP